MFPKIMGTLLGVPIIRTIVSWGLYWGPLILETTVSTHIGYRLEGPGFRVQGLGSVGFRVQGFGLMQKCAGRCSFRLGLLEVLLIA